VRGVGANELGAIIIAAATRPSHERSLSAADEAARLSLSLNAAAAPPHTLLTSNVLPPSAITCYPMPRAGNPAPFAAESCIDL